MTKTIANLLCELCFVIRLCSVFTFLVRHGMIRRFMHWYVWKRGDEFVQCSVVLCTYMIPDVSNNVQTREIHKFTWVTVGFIGPSVTVERQRARKGVGERLNTRGIKLEHFTSPWTPMCESHQIDSVTSGGCSIVCSPPASCHSCVFDHICVYSHISIYRKSCES